MPSAGQKSTLMKGEYPKFFLRSETDNWNKSYNMSRLFNNSRFRIRELLESITFCTLLLILYSGLKIIPGEKGDYLYAVAVISTSLIISMSRKLRAFLDLQIRCMFRIMHDFRCIQLFLLIIIYCLLWPSISFSLDIARQKLYSTQGLELVALTEVSFSEVLDIAQSGPFLAICGTIFVLISPRFSHRRMKTLQRKTVSFTLGFSASMIFLIQLIKTPATMPDFYHTVFAGDELLANQAGLINYSNYVGQYSNALTKFSSLISGHLQTSRQDAEWFLICMQIINVVLLFYICVRLSRNIAISCFFTMVVLASPFFAGAGSLDWLQNIPSRTFFPTIAILFCILLIDKLRVVYALAFVVFVSFSVYNDFLTGFQLVVSFIAVIVFGAKDIEKNRKLLYSFIFLLFSLVPIIYAAINSSLPISLLTTYYMSYGESGFAKEFNLLGPDIYIWGFAMGSILHSLRTLDLYGVRKSRESEFVLFASYLILSTIPYCVGRSYTAQIWSSSAIYLIILFSATIKLYLGSSKVIRVGSNEESEQSHYSINRGFIFPLIISLLSGFWNPSYIVSDIERITKGSNDTQVLFASESNPYKYEQDFLRSLRNVQLKVPSERISLLVPRGNLLSIKYGLRNDLVVNHPESLILKNQVRSLCVHLNGKNGRVFITDKNLAVRMREVLECQELFQFPYEGETTNRMVVALYSKSGG